MHGFLKSLWAVSLTTATLGIAQSESTGPSFSCAHVTSQVNKLICASPTLSALDKRLSEVFNNMKGQPIDQNQLLRDEAAWLSSLQNDCHDAQCIQRKYETRIAELRDQSERAASPAAYEETHPFPAPPFLLAEAKAAVGKPCTLKSDVVGPIIPGFTPAPRFLPVITQGGTTVVREKNGIRFAFLTLFPEPGNCQVRDVVVLPASAVGDRFLQCSVDDPQMMGFGVRNEKTHGLDGFWAVDQGTHKIERVPMEVLGIEKAVKCHQPESGE